MEVVVRISTSTFNLQLFKTCVCRLLQLADLPFLLLESRYSILQRCIWVYYHHQYYRQALACVQRYTAELPLARQNDVPLLRKAFCLVILRKPRHFYRAARQLWENFPESVRDELGEFLYERREYVKWHLLKK